MNFKNYVKAFFTDESGIEIMQVICIIALCCGVIALLANMFSVLGSKVEDVTDQIEGLDMTLS